MPAINFLKRFSSAVEAGEKRQTIRAVRKYPIKAGDKLYLYTGQRTRQSRKLKETKCKQVRDILIDDYYISLDDGCLNPTEADDFAVKDGFSDRHAMIKFFDKEYRLPFKGVVIEW